MSTAPMEPKEEMQPSDETLPKTSEEEPQTESATRKALQKCSVVQKASRLYNGVAECNGVTRLMARTADNVSSCALGLVLKTRVGKNADEVMAKAAGQAHEAIGNWWSWATFKKARESCGEKGQVESQNENPAKEGEEETKECSKFSLTGCLLLMVHLYFRFFPLCAMVRWAVHGCFLFSQATLALCMDLARLDTRNRKAPRPSESEAMENSLVDDPTHDADNRPSGDVGEETAASPSKEAPVPPAEPAEEGAVPEGSARVRSPRAAMKPIVTTSRFDTWMQELWAGIYAIFYLFDCYFFIPYFSVQTYVLGWLDDLMYSLAGIKGSDQDLEDRAQVERLLNAKPKNLSYQRWVVDAIVDKALGQMLRFPILGLVLCCVGITRPAKPFRNLARRISKEGKRNIDLAPYLREDPDYDESKDPDYVPVDRACDESLEYKSDSELDPDTTTEEPEVAGMRCAGKREPRKHRSSAPSEKGASEAAKEDVGSILMGSAFGEEGGQSRKGGTASSTGNEEPREDVTDHSPCMLGQVERLLGNRKSDETPKQGSNDTSSSSTVSESLNVDQGSQGQSVGSQTDAQYLPPETTVGEAPKTDSHTSEGPPTTCMPHFVGQMIQLDVSVRTQDEPLVLADVDPDEKSDCAPGALYIGFSGFYGALMVCNPVPQDDGLDESLLNMEHVTYIKDGKEFTTAEEAGFVWESEDLHVKKSPLKIGWLNDYLAKEANDEVGIDVELGVDQEDHPVEDEVKYIGHLEVPVEGSDTEQSSRSPEPCRLAKAMEPSDVNAGETDPEMTEIGATAPCTP